MNSINLEINIPSESYKTVIDVLRAFNVKIKDLKAETDFFYPVYPELEEKIKKARKEKEDGTLKTFNSVEELWQSL